MKKLFILFVCFFALPLFAFPCFSADARDSIGDTVNERFFGQLDSDVADILEENGIDSLDSGEIFSSGTKNIASFFSQTLKEKLGSATGWFFLMLCLLMLISVFSSVYDFSSVNDTFSLFSVLIIIAVTVGKISPFVSCTVSAMALNSKLMLAFVPVYTLLVSLAGNPAAALTYNSFVLFFCEIMSAFINEIFLYFTGAYFALSLAFSFNGAINLSRFTNSVNRLVSVILGFLASIFTGLLSLKNILSFSTDSLSSRGVRFLLGSLIPVIGPSLSEAYSTVLGSINLMKGSLGVIGIFGLVLINIPALCEGVVYYGFMAILSCFAEVTGLVRASETLRCFSSCVKILLLLCIFQLFILVISTGMLLSLKGGANG